MSRTAPKLPDFLTLADGLELKDADFLDGNPDNLIGNPAFVTSLCFALSMHYFVNYVIFVIR